MKHMLNLLNSNRFKENKVRETEGKRASLPPGHIPVDRFLSVPATINRELVGLISLANSERDYTERDIALVERLADLFAIAIKRKQTEDELQRKEIN